MANDGEDRNELRYGFLKKHWDVRFSKAQVDLENLSYFAKMLLQCGLPSRNCFSSSSS